MAPSRSSPGVPAEQPEASRQPCSGGAELDRGAAKRQARFVRPSMRLLTSARRRNVQKRWLGPQRENRHAVVRECQGSVSGAHSDSGAKRSYRLYFPCVSTISAASAGKPMSGTPARAASSRGMNFCSFGRASTQKVSGRPARRRRFPPCTCCGARRRPLPPCPTLKATHRLSGEINRDGTCVPRRRRS
ncbi:MAG: hypothetical protein JWQ73_1237 [Variovorax sp.]|nr:hypothetical protein [Variovorax sp.]